MNILQIIRMAHLEVDAIRADGQTSALWSQEESRNAVNSAMERASRITRLAGSNILTRSIRSTGAAEEFTSESYDPGVLQITAGTTEYTLPPDFVSVVNILPLSEGFDEIRFYPGEPQQRLVTDQGTIPSADLQTVANSATTYHYVILGGRTLRLVPTPQDDFDIELIYRFRPAKLMAYSAGKVVLNNLSSSVHGKGVTWITSGVRTPVELVTDAVTSLDQNYQRVASITSETDLTLSKPWAGATAVEPGAPYTLAMVPQLPEEHHQWLAHMTAAILLRKVNLDISEKSKQALELQLLQEVQPEITVRQVQESIPVEPFQIPN